MHQDKAVRRPRGLMAGLLMIAVGLLFLGERLDWLRSDLAWSWWPGILVVMGLARLGWAQDREQRKGGLVLLLMGGWLLVNTLELFDLHWGSSWPLLLIGFGLIWTWEAIAGAGDRRQEAVTPTAEERHD
jgi:hypothetical protein